MGRLCTGSCPEESLFTLDKWYLDLVTDDGTAVIGYAARIRSGPLSAAYASCLVSPPDRAPTDAAAIRGVQLPALDGHTLRWDCPGLALAGEWSGESPPIVRTLLDTGAGSLTWECLLPRARARLSLASRELAGHGYAERLRLTMSPGELPFDTLRWGRHVSDRHSVVWIEWEGATGFRGIWLDGEEQPEARLTPTGVTGLEHGRSLRFEGSRTLRDRPVLGAVGAALPEFARRLAGPLGAMRERKLLDRSSVMAGQEPLDRGWSIHEEVRW